MLLSLLPALTGYRAPNLASGLAANRNYKNSWPTVIFVQYVKCSYIRFQSLDFEQTHIIMLVLQIFEASTSEDERACGESRPDHIELWLEP